LAPASDKRCDDPVPGRFPVNQVTIRREELRDAGGVARLHELAFGRSEEGALVAALRRGGAATLGLVAEAADGEVVGHVLFSPVVIDRVAGPRVAIGLAPLAVVPGEQGKGIGSRLVREGLAELLRLGHDAVVVVGHPAYYPRFGFVRASLFGLRWEVEGHEDSFMAVELRPGALRQGGGIVRYRPEFAGM
jgi:putative acetyltransferase